MVSIRSTDGKASHAIAMVSRRPSFAVLLVLVWILTGLRLLHEYWYATAITFPDVDDAMRLAQWRDFINGQGWFDLHQPRLSPPQGYETHWSRLIDAGLARLYFFFRLFTDDPMAERLMRAIWPLLWILPAMAGVAAIAWRLAGAPAAIAALVLALAGGSAYHQFLPGTIDHHNVQIALTMVAVAATVWSDRILWCASAAGFLTALSIAIGLEALPYLAVCGAAMAFRFAWFPDAARSVRRYAISLMAGVVGLALATLPSDRWLQVQCDALAPNLIAAILPAAVVLVIAASLNAPRTTWRFASVFLAAILAIAVVLWIEPRCFLGPYALMDQRMWALWLSSVYENQPLTKILASNPFRVFPMLAFSALCLIAAIVFMRAQSRRDFASWVACAVFLMGWLTICIAIRATPYAIWLGIPVMAAAVMTIGRPGSALSSVSAFGSGSALGSCSALGSWRLAPVLLLSPFILGKAMTLALPANAFSTASSGGELTRFCRLSAHVRELASLPAGLIAADVFHGAHILALTPHSVLAAPYHRSMEGTIVAHRILAAPPDEAKYAAHQAGVAYIALCGPRPPDGLSDEDRKRSLWAHLEAGAAPDWLDPVISTIGRPFTVYRIRP